MTKKASPQKKYTFHAYRDYFLWGFNAAIRRNGTVIYLSPDSYPTRKDALRGARFQYSSCHVR